MTLKTSIDATREFATDAWDACNGKGKLSCQDDCNTIDAIGEAARKLLSALPKNPMTEAKIVEIIAQGIAMVYPETPQRKSYDEARAVLHALKEANVLYVDGGSTHTPTCGRVECICGRCKGYTK